MGIATYYKKRLARLLFPYLSWSFIYIFILPYIKNGCISNNWLFLLCSGNGPLYFLLALSQFTFLVPMLQKYKNNFVANILFWLVTPLYLIFYYIFNFKTGTEFKPEQFFCFPWFAVYYLGLKLQDSKKIECLENNSILVYFMMICALLFSLVEGIWLYYRTSIYSFAISQITIGSILYSLSVILLFYKGKMCYPNYNESFLSKLGDYSMGIFLIHPFFNWIYKFVIYHIFQYMYENPINQLFFHMLILILSVISSYYVAKYLSRIFPNLNLFLGLK